MDCLYAMHSNSSQTYEGYIVISILPLRNLALAMVNGSPRDTVIKEPMLMLQPVLKVFLRIFMKVSTAVSKKVAENLRQSILYVLAEFQTGVFSNLRACKRPVLCILLCLGYAVALCQESEVFTPSLVQDFLSTQVFSVFEKQQQNEPLDFFHSDQSIMRGVFLSTLFYTHWQH